MKVLLPTPGTPVIPIRRVSVSWARQASMTVFAIAWCSGFVLSTRVIALLSAAISWLRIPVTSLFGSYFCPILFSVPVCALVFLMRIIFLLLVNRNTDLSGVPRQVQIELVFIFK